jgi:hypothetical protein
VAAIGQQVMQPYHKSTAELIPQYCKSPSCKRILAFKPTESAVSATTDYLVNRGHSRKQRSWRRDLIKSDVVLSYPSTYIQPRKTRRTDLDIQAAKWDSKNNPLLSVYAALVGLKQWDQDKLLQWCQTQQTKRVASRLDLGFSLARFRLYRTRTCIRF